MDAPVEGDSDVKVDQGRDGASGGTASAQGG